MKKRYVDATGYAGWLDSLGASAKELKVAETEKRDEAKADSSDDA